MGKQLEKRLMENKSIKKAINDQKKRYISTQTVTIKGQRAYLGAQSKAAQSIGARLASYKFYVSLSYLH